MDQLSLDLHETDTADIIYCILNSRYGIYINDYNYYYFIEGQLDWGRW